MHQTWSHHCLLRMLRLWSPLNLKLNYGLESYNDKYIFNFKSFAISIFFSPVPSMVTTSEINVVIILLLSSNSLWIQNQSVIPFICKKLWFVLFWHINPLPGPNFPDLFKTTFFTFFFPFSAHNWFKTCWRMQTRLENTFVGLWK